MRVLFVCRANIGRSQMAEAFFRSQIGDRYEVESVGTNVRDRDGLALKDINPPHLIPCMDEAGLDIRDQKVKAISPEVVDRASLIISMAERDTCLGYLCESKKVAWWDINDPKGTDYENHCRIRDEIETQVSRLVRDIRIAYD